LRSGVFEEAPTSNLTKFNLNGADQISIDQVGTGKTSYNPGGVGDSEHIQAMGGFMAFRKEALV